MLHLVLSSSATFNKRLQFAHVMAWDGGQLCFGCNTTVIFMMKRIIYFLMTSNKQEVLSQTESLHSLCVVWIVLPTENCDVDMQKHEDSITIFILEIFRSDTWCCVDVLKILYVCLSL